MGKRGERLARPACVLVRGDRLAVHDTGESGDDERRRAAVRVRHVQDESLVSRQREVPAALSEDDGLASGRFAGQGREHVADGLDADGIRIGGERESELVDGSLRLLRSRGLRDGLERHGLDSHLQPPSEGGAPLGLSDGCRGLVQRPCQRAKFACRNDLDCGTGLASVSRLGLTKWQDWPIRYT